MHTPDEAFKPSDQSEAPSATAAPPELVGGGLRFKKSLKEVAGEELSDGDDDGNSSVAAEASSSASSIYIDPAKLRAYHPSQPLPWTTFLRLRKSWGSIALSPTQEASVMKALAKIPQGIGTIHDSLPFVTAFMDKHCPELKQYSGNVTTQRPGATFLMLSVITGHAALCQRCLDLGANPNSCKLLMDADAPANRMRHGYSPIFMACICEQIEIMALLRKHGGSVHTVDRWGRTPLHAAAAMGSTEVVEWLIKEGAPRNVVDVNMERPGEVCVGKVIPALERPSPIFRCTTDQPRACHCHSSRVSGQCGCVDDMHDRWFVDRASSSWLGSLTVAGLRSTGGH